MMYKVRLAYIIDKGVYFYIYSLEIDAFFYLKNTMMCSQNL